MISKVAKNELGWAKRVNCRHQQEPLEDHS